jgi:type II restriction enzyme
VFDKLLSLITECSRDSFGNATKRLEDFIFSTNCFNDVLLQIGTIPESIAHDSTEEKLYAKVSDAVLSRVFRELGLKSRVLSGRGDSADVFVESNIHGYTFVADAKAFRLSRTAINQKDLKVVDLSAWKEENDYAVICSPYYRYPRKESQIYAQALDYNVCLLGWEHLIFLLQQGIRESKTLNLSALWNFGSSIANKTVIAEKKKCFIRDFDAIFLSTLGLHQEDFDCLLSSCIEATKIRGDKEIAYWEAERKTILSYSRKQAIEELMQSRKIDEKIQQIEAYARRVSRA